MVVSLDTPQNAYLLPRTDTAGETLCPSVYSYQDFGEVLNTVWTIFSFDSWAYNLYSLSNSRRLGPIRDVQTYRTRFVNQNLIRCTGSPDNAKTELSGSISWSKSRIAFQDHWHKFQNLHHSVPKLLSLHFHALVGCSLLLSVNRLFSFQKIYFSHSKFTGNCRRSRLLMRALALLSKIATNIMSVIEAN